VRDPLENDTVVLVARVHSIMAAVATLLSGRRMPPNPSSPGLSPRDHAKGPVLRAAGIPLSCPFAVKA
jgi:hypothetical protein